MGTARVPGRCFQRMETDDGEAPCYGTPTCPQRDWRSPIEKGAVEARQGRRGRRVLIILAVSLALIVMAYFLLYFYFPRPPRRGECAVPAADFCRDHACGDPDDGAGHDVAQPMIVCPKKADRNGKRKGHAKPPELWPQAPRRSCSGRYRGRVAGGKGAIPLTAVEQEEPISSIAEV